MEPESLFDKYGGVAGVSALVLDFYRRIQADEALDLYFWGVKMDRLIGHQTSFLCKVLGGPDNYQGRALEAAHHHLHITEADFGRVAAHLRDSLEDMNVDPDDIDAIMGVVASTQPQIVKPRSQGDALDLVGG